MTDVLGVLAFALLLAGCAMATFACLRGRSDALAALGVILPMVSAAVTVVAWMHERRATNGDPEPGLVLFTGGAVTGALVLGAVGGALARARAQPPSATAALDGDEAPGDRRPPV